MFCLLDEYLAFQSEIKELEKLLADIPENNVLERMSLEARLKAAKSAIDGISEPKENYKAKLTFRGKPVSGCHGIAADFGSKASGLFSDVITAIASGLTDNLQGTGPIPDKQKNQLLITDIAIGSFGFAYELPSSEMPDLFEESSNVEMAIILAQNLFRCAAEGSDDDIAEIMEKVHPRAIKKVAEFLNYVTQQEAWCAIDFKDQSFRFQSLEQIKVSSNRLQENNIHKRAENFEGVFQGVLPAYRTFEFKCEDGMIIKGKIAQSLTDPDELNRKYLYKHVKVEFNVTQVGKGKPRFELPCLEKIIFSHTH
ncbi:MAG TPA: hypothetical protein VLE95_06205 [Chlamydiales bacterium]|nr:hypothetical protein [Chlamydiales bacterium]